MIWAERYNLDPNLIALVMQLESVGNKCPKPSSAGALGLFQVMPFHFTAEELKEACNPEVNASKGLPYLRGSQEKAKGDIPLTLAGYNGGHGTIDINPLYWYDETKLYVSKGMNLWNGYMKWKNGN